MYDDGIYMCIYVCNIYIQLNTHTYIYIYVYIYICVCVRVCNKYICSANKRTFHLHTQIYIYIHVAYIYIYIYLYVYIVGRFLNIDAKEWVNDSDYIGTLSHTHLPSLSLTRALSLITHRDTLSHIYTYIRCCFIYIKIHTYIHIYIYIYIYTYIYIYI